MMSVEPVNPERRVLSDKSTNALLSTSNPRTLAGKENTPVSPSDTGVKCAAAVTRRKRSIEEIDCDQNNNAFCGDISSSPSPKKRSKAFYIFDETSVQGMEDTRKDAGITLIGAPLNREHQQNSSSSISQTNARNSPNPDPSSISDTSTNHTITGVGSVGLSSARTTNAWPPTSGDHCETASVIPTDPIAYKSFINEKATLLRSRIQRAMKRMEQKQEMERRVSEFEAYSQRRTELAQMTQPSNTGNDDENQGESAEDDTTPKARKVAKLLPAPDICPRGRKSTPASISATESPAAGEELDTGCSPAQQNNDSHDETPTSPISHSTPPKSHKGDEEPVIIERDAFCSVEKMIVKANKRGEAVDGLLKLMKTTAEYDNLDILDGV